MSRVDEALRRAQDTAATAAGQSAESSLSDADVANFADEPYPVEIREHRSRSVGKEPARESHGPLVIEHGAQAAERPADVPSPAGSSLVHVAELGTMQPASTRGRLLERMDTHLAEKVVIDQEMSGASREQYRKLAATLHHRQASGALRVVMVTSAVPGEGKTLTSSNLALTFSESYKRNVLLIDGDLRRPSLHTVFQLDNSSGLSDGLAAEEERPLTIRQVSPRLAILQAGKPTSDPMSLLTSERMRRLVLEARESFDWVIIDTPPVALLPDANLLVSMADGALLVVKAGSTPYELVQRAANALIPRTLGVVLNRATGVTHTGRYGYYADYYYGGEREEP